MTTDFSLPPKSAILRIDEVCKRTSLSSSTVYNKVKEDSKYHDPTFPQQVRLGANAVGWKESEVEAWVASRSIVQTTRSRTASPCSSKFSANTREAVNVEKDKSPLQSFEDRLHEKHVQTLELILEKCATTGSRILRKYAMGNLMLNPDRPEEVDQMDRIIASVSTRSHVERRGLLGVLVHDPKLGGNMPNEQFFKLAKSLGYKFESQEAFTESQLIYQFEIREPVDKKAGKLTWYEAKGTPLLMRC